MVTGKLERGVIKKGDDAIILGHGKTFKTTITGTCHVATTHVDSDCDNVYDSGIACVLGCGCSPSTCFQNSDAHNLTVVFCCLVCLT